MRNSCAVIALNFHTRQKKRPSYDVYCCTCRKNSWNKMRGCWGGEVNSGKEKHAIWSKQFVSCLSVRLSLISKLSCHHSPFYVFIIFSLYVLSCLYPFSRLSLRWLLRSLFVSSIFSLLSLYSLSLSIFIYSGVSHDESHLSHLFLHGVIHRIQNKSNAYALCAILTDTLTVASIIIVVHETMMWLRCHFWFVCHWICQCGRSLPEGASKDTRA